MPLTKIRLSHSTIELLNLCERKFQIDRLIATDRSEETAPWFSRGHAFGKGVQVYLLTGDMDLALYQAWLNYYPELEQEIKFTQHRTLHILLSARPHLDEIRTKYEVVSFHGKPAVELGIRIIIDEVYYFVGFIDLVLRSRATGRYVVFEVKCTSSWHDVDIMFHNSGQGIGYSIALDSIVGKELADYDVLYFVCQDSNAAPKDIKYHPLLLAKTLKDRLNWFITLGIDVERIKRMREINVFPMRGQSCLAYNKRCPHFGLCQLTSGDVEKNDVPDKYEQQGLYAFTFNLDELVKDHLRRI